MKRLALMLLFGMMLLVIPKVDYGSDLPSTSGFQVGVPPGSPQMFTFEAPAIQPPATCYQVQAVEIVNTLPFTQAELTQSVWREELSQPPSLTANLAITHRAITNRLNKDATYLRLLYRSQHGALSNLKQPTGKVMLETYATLMFVKYRSQSF